MGETTNGDTTLYEIVQGKKKDIENERRTIEKISSPLQQTQKILLNMFDEFEGGIDNINTLEVAVARWIDNLQGDHFALTFGSRLPEHSEAINKIIQIRSIASTNRLLELLEDKDHNKAVDEVKQVAHHHFNVIKAAGITIDTSKLNT